MVVFFRREKDIKTKHTAGDANEIILERIARRNFMYL